MSKEEATDMTVFVALLMRVARAFFQTPQIVVLDCLTRHEAISDESLARGVGLTVKEIHKLCGTLKEARLIKTFTKAEPKKAEQRAIPRTYYYIDWQQVVNVVKWKIYRIREMVGDRMRNEQENKGYLCPGCKKTFAPLDIRNLFDMTKSAFVCDLCHHELIHNDNAENVKGTEKLHGRFMEQSQPIIDLLKIVDKLVIPISSIDNMQATSGAKGDQPGSSQGHDVQYARDTNNPHMADIVVVFQDDNVASKMDRQADIDKKRHQNALPAWHVRSTVSGEILPSNVRTTNAAQESEHQKADIGNVNEKDDERENFYAKYYANLGANGNDDEFEEVDINVEDYEDDPDESMGGDEFEEVNIEERNGYASDDEDYNIVDLDENTRINKRLRTGYSDGSNGYHNNSNGNRKSNGNRN